MAGIVALSFPSLEALLGRDFSKLLDATKCLPTATIWLQGLENSVKVLAQKFGENFVKPLANLLLTELDRVSMGERSLESAMLETFCFAKLAMVADKFEVLLGCADIPTVKFRLADRECAAEWCDLVEREVDTLPRKFALMRWRVNLLFVSRLTAPKFEANILPLLYGQDFEMPSPFNPFEGDFVVPQPEELGGESLFARPDWKIVSGVVWLSHHFQNQTVCLSGFVFPNPNALRRIPLEVAVKLHEALNLQTFPCDASERREAAEWLATRFLKRLEEKWQVKRAIVWGSLRDSIFWHRRSDIDIVVEGLDWKQLVKAEEDLIASSPFVIPIHLTDWDSLPEGWQRCLERGDAFMSDWREKVRHELEQVKTAVEIAQREMAKSDPAQELTVRVTVAKALHDFYNGVERILQHLLAISGEEAPTGKDWHKELLEQVAEVTIISPNLKDELDEYREFRHVFRSIYVFQLDWNKMKALAQRLPEVYERVRHEIEDFIARFSGEETSSASKE